MPCKKYLNGSENKIKLKQAHGNCRKLELKIRNIYAGGPITQFLPWALSFLVTALSVCIYIYIHTHTHNTYRYSNVLLLHRYTKKSIWYCHIQPSKK
jgi:hypothetical protein